MALRLGFSYVSIAMLDCDTYMINFLCIMTMGLQFPILYTAFSTKVSHVGLLLANKVKYGSLVQPRSLSHLGLSFAQQSKVWVPSI